MGTFRCRAVESDPQLNVVIPVDIYNELAIRARDSGRSLEVELLSRLARTFESKDAQMVEDALISLVLDSACKISKWGLENDPPPKGR